MTQIQGTLIILALIPQVPVTGYYTKFTLFLTIKLLLLHIPNLILYCPLIHLGVEWRSLRRHVQELNLVASNLCFTMSQKLRDKACLLAQPLTGKYVKMRAHLQWKPFALVYAGRGILTSFMNCDTTTSIINVLRRKIRHHQINLMGKLIQR